MSKKVQQISFLSAIAILVSGTIGSGIFFKNTSLFQLSQGNAGFVLSVWIVTAIGIIAFGIGISEMSSKVVGGKGILEWTKHFMPLKYHLMAKNYVQLIFIPLICFALPLYGAKAVHEALSNYSIFLSGWKTAGIGFLFFLWFSIITYISIWFSIATQWFTLIIKFIPILILPILSLIMKSTISSSTYFSLPSNHPIGFSSLGSGWMVLIAGIPAIMFSIDGFYTVTTLRDKMKDPKKMSTVIVVGLSIITIIYIWISLSFMHGSKTGKYTDIQWFIKQRPQILSIFSWLITIGILGVVNGYIQFGVNTYINLHKSNESWLTRWFETKIYKNKIKEKLSSFITFNICVFIMFAIMTIIGIYGWHKTGNDPPPLKASYSNLVDFDNVITNFKSLLMFVTIASALAFAIAKFKKKTLKQQCIYYLSILAVIFVFIALLYQYISTGVDMFGFRKANKISSIISFALLIFIPTFCYICALIENKMILKNNKKL